MCSYFFYISDYLFLMVAPVACFAKFVLIIYNSPIPGRFPSGKMNLFSFFFLNSERMPGVSGALVK